MKSLSDDAGGGALSKDHTHTHTHTYKAFLEYIRKIVFPYVPFWPEIFRFRLTLGSNEDDVVPVGLSWRAGLGAAGRPGPVRL
jgi:hypothetical protein